MTEPPQSYLLQLSEPLPKRVKKISLLRVLILPYVLLVTGSVGLVGYLSFKSGQQAVNHLSNHLMADVNARVNDRLNSFLQTQQQVVKVTQKTIEQGNLKPEDLQSLRAYLWQQTQLLPQTSDPTYATEQGTEIGYVVIGSQETSTLAEKISGKKVPVGTYLFHQRGQSQKSWRYYYRVDPEGQPAEFIYKKTINTRSLSWYQAIKAAGKQTWTPVFIPRVAPSLSIAAGAPVFAKGGKLMGVFASILALSDINTFLSSLNFSDAGQVFILERSGDLIATSTSELPISLPPGKPPQRLAGIHSQNATTRAITSHLLQQFGHLNQIQSAQTFDLISNGQRWFVQVTPYHDSYGLDWLVVVTVPESEFIGPIQANGYTTIALSALTLAAAIFVGWLMTRLIDLPIQRLSLASQALAKGQWQESLQEDSPIAELSSLSHSFNRNAEQLQQAFDRIKMALQESEEKFTKVFRSSPDPISIVALDGTYLEVNDSFLHFSEYGRAEVIGRTSLELDISTDLQQDARLAELLQTEGSVQGFEFHYRAKSGRLGFSLISLGLIELEGQPCVLAISKDISDRKQMEAELRRTEQWLQQYSRQAPGSIYTLVWEPDGQVWFEYISAAVQTIYEVSQADALADARLILQQTHPEDRVGYREAGRKSAENLTLFSHEWRIITPSGQLKWLQANSQPERRSNGAVAWYGVIQDISDRKVIENSLKQLNLELEQRVEERTAALQASLQEKVLLLREIHHRVKNNLQIVSSLLMLQADTTTDPHALSLLQESQERIYAIALVHEYLYQSSTLSQVDFSAYAHKLAEQIFATWGHPKLKLHLCLEPIVLNLETAFPCGLLLNELITNAVKHGFPDRAAGDIWVEFHQFEKSFFLTVKDNGIGFPEHLNFRQTESLGLQLVCDLAQQLDGQLSLTSLEGNSDGQGRGTCFSLQFQELVYSKRL
uniref:histidine kinase n=1 Tax=Cyanothece sp. (strain PCC 7425 / ATCC 29141) TaxID=395961 RepID=B8HV59_CYAP4